MSTPQRSLRRYGDDHVSDPWMTLMDAFFSNDRVNDVAQKVGGWSGDMKVDSRENDEAFLISADLPGVDKNDIKVSVTRDRVLCIEAERRHEDKGEEQKDGNHTHWLERSFGKISRSLRLPKNANPEDYRCKFDNGVLDIRIGKKDPESETNVLSIE